MSYSVKVSRASVLVLHSQFRAGVRTLTGVRRRYRRQEAQRRRLRAGGVTARFVSMKKIVGYALNMSFHRG